MATTVNGFITELEPNEVIVVGTNARGEHAGGAAKQAHEQFGLEWGVGEGLSGQTYALPTMEGTESFIKAIDTFIKYARCASNKKFMVTKVGCGIAAYKENDIKQTFNNYHSLPINIILPTNWRK